MKLIFSREAQIDAALMNREGLRLFGPNQAAKYQAGMRDALRTIEAFPMSNPERHYKEQKVRVRPYGSHLILYTVDDEALTILRIRHVREDWQAG